MKQTYITLIAFLLTIAGQAQLVITKSYTPAVTDKFSSYFISPPSKVYTAGSGGANQSWDFSMYVQDSMYQNYGSEIPVSKKPVYPKANLAQITSYHDTNFYQVTDTALTSWGYHSSSLGNTVYSDGQTILKYPFSYNQTYSDSAKGNSTIIYGGAIQNSTRKGKTTVLYDGYGTLILPGGKIYGKVGRVMTNADAVDLIYNPISKTYVPIASNVTSYFWYAEGISYPVFTMATLTVPLLSQKSTLAFYSDIYNPASVDAAWLSSFIKASPNPVQDLLNISVTLPSSEATSILIKSLNGKTMMASDLPAGSIGGTINVNHLPSGFYFIEIENKGLRGVLKFVKN